MICPECKAEFVEGITHCTDCDVQLVEELPEEPKYKKLELEIIYETADPALIQIVKSILADAGIPYKIKSAGLQTIYAFGLVKFQVNSDDAATAQELLKDLIQ
jgi:putative signal transducing protein